MTTFALDARTGRETAVAFCRRFNAPVQAIFAAGL
jgi:hypothetical protein